MDRARHKGTSHVRELEDEPLHEVEPVVRYTPNPPFRRIPVRAVRIPGPPEHDAARAR